MGLEDPFPVLTRETGPEELGVSLSIALLDSVGVILVVGVCDSLPVGVVEDLPVLGNVEDVFGVFEGFILLILWGSISQKLIFLVCSVWADCDSDSSVRTLFFKQPRMTLTKC